MELSLSTWGQSCFCAILHTTERDLAIEVRLRKPKLSTVALLMAGNEASTYHHNENQENCHRMKKRHSHKIDMPGQAQ